MFPQHSAAYRCGPEKLMNILLEPYVTVHGDQELQLKKILVHFTEEGAALTSIWGKRSFVITEKPCQMIALFIYAADVFIMC